MEGFRRILTRLLVSACIIGILAISWYALQDFGAHEAHGRITWSQIELTPHPPDYISRQFRDEVRALGQLPESLDYPAPDLPVRLQRAFGAHPWVESIQRVDTRSRHHIQVGLIFRTPAAVIVVEPRRWLVDRHCVVLPRGPETANLEASLLPIRGLQAPLPPEPGRAWNAAEVEAAVTLAGAVHAERNAWQLEAIELGADPLVPDLRLRTKRGTIIIWDTLAESASQGGVPASEKLRRLRDYCAEFGNLDGPAGPYELNVRPAAGLLRRKLADRTAPEN
jgi:hypothetical protein